MADVVFSFFSTAVSRQLNHRTSLRTPATPPQGKLHHIYTICTYQVRLTCYRIVVRMYMRIFRRKIWHCIYISQKRKWLHHGNGLPSCLCIWHQHCIAKRKLFPPMARSWAASPMRWRELPPPRTCVQAVLPIDCVDCIQLYCCCCNRLKA